MRYLEVMIYLLGDDGEKTLIRMIDNDAMHFNYQ